MLDIFSINLNHYLILSALVFCIGMVGVLMRRNLIVMLMSIELMLNGVNLSLVAFSQMTENLNGHVLVFFVMTVAAAEAGVGLALLVAAYKQFKSLDFNLFENLKG